MEETKSKEKTAQMESKDDEKEKKELVETSSEED